MTTASRSFSGALLSFAGFLAGIVFITNCGGGVGTLPTSADAEDGVPGLVVHRRTIAGPHAVPNAAVAVLTGQAFAPAAGEAVLYAAAEVDGLDPARGGFLTLELRDVAGNATGVGATQGFQAGATGLRVVVPLEAVCAPTGPHACEAWIARVLYGGSDGPQTLLSATVEFGVLQGVVLEDPSGRLTDDPLTLDMDADGVTPLGGDCDDGNPDVFPGATEVANGIDDDCDGQLDDVPGISFQFPDEFDSDAERVTLSFERMGDLGGAWQDSAQLAAGECGNAGPVGGGGNDYVFRFEFDAEVLAVIPNPDPTYTRTIRVTGGPNAVPVDLAIYVVGPGGCEAFVNDVTDPAQVNLGEELTFVFDSSKSYDIVVDVAADPNGHQPTSIPFQVTCGPP